MSATAASPVDFRSTMIVPPKHDFTCTHQTLGPAALTGTHCAFQSGYFASPVASALPPVKAVARAIGMVANEPRPIMTMLSAYVVLTHLDRARPSHNK